MLSRVANSIYWMNRYIERVENYARFISVNINLSYEIPGLEHWSSLLDATGEKADFLNFYGDQNSQKIIDFMTFDTLNQNSIFNTLSFARENARTIREILPKEVWEHLNGFFLDIKQKANSENRELDNPTVFFEHIKEECQLFSGMIDATLTRNEGYYFASLGRFIERADKTSRFIDIDYFNFNPGNQKKIVSPQDMLVWSAVLKSVSALNMYRQEYKSLKQESIIEFLIKDRGFPRSLCFCLKSAENALFRISGNHPNDRYSNSAEKVTGQLAHDLDYIETSDIIKIGLHKYLNDFQTKNNQLTAKSLKNISTPKLIFKFASGNYKIIKK